MQELLEYMSGPDFPTEGLIMGNHSLLSEAWFILIPYQTNKSAVVEKITELVENKVPEPNVGCIKTILNIRSKWDVDKFMFHLLPCSSPTNVPPSLRVACRLRVHLRVVWEDSESLEGISDIRDEGDRLECVLSLSIHNGQSKQMGLKELLQ
ncbi:Pectinacetylesterase family protein, partial [Prunus dulcis]